MSEGQRRPPPPKPTYLFRFSDGSVLRKMSARDLVKIPIWRGNRIIDLEHRKSIANSLRGGIQTLDMKPFHIVSYPAEEEGDEEVEGQIRHALVDGQHRLSILREADHLDFEVLVVEKECKSEGEVIEYFKILNHTKAIEWREDPKIVAGRFIAAMEKTFNTGKEKLIRTKATHRPYLYVESLRDELEKRKIGLDGKTPEQFAEYCKRVNAEQLTAWGEGKDKLQRRGVEIGFALAYDLKFKWLDGF